MAQLDGEQIQRQLARGPLPPALLIAGQEILLVLEAADAVRARAREEGYARDVFDVDARFDWDELVAGFSSMSLFANRRLIDVRLPTGKPGKEGGEAIAAFCANPPPDTVLLVTCLEWSKKHAETGWVRAIAKVGHTATLWQMQRHKLPDWLLARMRARGINARHDAAELLAERVEGNLLAAAQEVDKLALLVGTAPAAANDSPIAPRKSADAIDAAAMDRLVADSSRFDAFKLIDAALAGEASRALRMLRSLRAEGEAVPGLMGPVVGPVLALAALAQVKASGGNLGAAMQAQRIWESKQSLYKRALERHDADRWERFAIECGRIDRIAKGRAAGDAWLALERLLAAIAQPRAHRLLA
jgi:DNA polymerase-3 subunit delta